MRNPKHRRQFAIAAAIGLAALGAAGFLTDNAVYYAAAVVIAATLVLGVLATYDRRRHVWRPEWFSQYLLFIAVLWSIVGLLVYAGR